jgi:hypothetical protein
LSTEKIEILNQNKFPFDGGTPFIKSIQAAAQICKKKKKKKKQSRKSASAQRFSTKIQHTLFEIWGIKPN